MCSKPVELLVKLFLTNADAITYAKVVQQCMYLGAVRIAKGVNFTPFAMRTAPNYIHCCTTIAYVIASALVKKNLTNNSTENKVQGNKSKIGKMEVVKT